MRVWMLDPSFKSPAYDLHLMSALQEQGVEIELIASQYVHVDLTPKPNLHINYFFFRSLRRWKNLLRKNSLLRWGLRLLVYGIDLFRFRRLLKSNPPDVLHIQWTLFPRLDRMFFRSIAKHVPIVLTVHNPAVRKSLLAKFDDMVSFTEFADQIIVHAEQNREQLLQRRALPSGQVHGVPHGPLFEDFEEVTSQQARQHLGISENTPLILFFGIIKPYKGLHDLIAAMPTVLAAIPNAQLIIAGPKQESLESYSQAIAEHHLEEHITLHVTFIKNENVPFYFGASNVVCLPYREASQSGALLSAYRFGKPVVVTNVGALPETVDHGKNGLVVPAQNVDALAQALIEILSDPAMQRRFGEHSRQLARERLSWATAAQKTIDVYQLAQDRHTRHPK
jgi:glycosyltransferase involved in cell wall biosynthesis